LFVSFDLFEKHSEQLRMIRIMKKKKTIKLRFISNSSPVTILFAATKVPPQIYLGVVDDRFIIATILIIK
jgi:hypothetical protein